MSKGKRKRKRPSQPGGSGPPTANGTGVLDELDARAGEIAAADPDASGPLWGAIHKLLLKTDAAPGEAGRLVATRDLDGLRRLLARLRGDTPPDETVTETTPASGATSATPDVPAEIQKKAMRAFRKRLKLTRLDHESKLGVGPMTGGKKAAFDAILPPHDFAPEVWEALVAAGRLRDVRQGFYMLSASEAEV